MVRLWICAFIIFISSCKAADPELVNIFAGKDSESTSPSAQVGSGSLTLLSDPQVVSAGNYKVKGRLTMLNGSEPKTTPNYKVRGYVNF